MIILSLLEKMLISEQQFGSFVYLSEIFGLIVVHSLIRNLLGVCYIGLTPVLITIKAIQSFQLQKEFNEQGGARVFLLGYEIITWTLELAVVYVALPEDLRSTATNVWAVILGCLLQIVMEKVGSDRLRTEEERRFRQNLLESFRKFYNDHFNTIYSATARNKIE